MARPVNSEVRWQEHVKLRVEAGQEDMKRRAEAVQEQLNKRLRELKTAQARLRLRLRFKQQALLVSGRRMRTRVRKRIDTVKTEFPRSIERIKVKSTFQLQRAGDTMQRAVVQLRPDHLTLALVRLLQELRHKLELSAGRTWRAVARKTGTGEFNATASNPTRSKERARLVAEETTEVLRLLVMVSAGPGWNHVTDSKGVRVWRKYLRLSDLACGDDETMVPVVKAFAVVDAPAEKVFQLLQDNARVHEYNDNCNLVVDVEQLDENTKVTWALSAKHGPFKAREFTTLVHFRRLPDGRLFVVNKAAERARSCTEVRERGRPKSVAKDAAVRSEIFLAGTLLRPLQSDPLRKTEIVQITSIDIGGLANTRAGAMLVNWMTSTSPVSFIRRLEAASQRDKPPGR